MSALVDAGVLADDDSTRLDGPNMRIGEKRKHGQVVLIITDLGGAA